MSKKKTLLAAVVLFLAATIALGSLAYFTAHGSVSNKFMMATYDPDDPDRPVDPDDLFSVSVFETEDGVATTSGKTYLDIAPGDVLDKDPTVTNTGRYDAWVRVSVTATNAGAWKAALAKHGITDLATIFGGHEESKWERGEIVEAGDTITYTYYLLEPLAPGESATLFKTVTIPAAFDVQDMVSLGTFEIIVGADAIQKANTGDTAKEAFANCWD